MRRRPSETRRSEVHKFSIRSKDDGLVEGYIIVGLYDDGTPCELFLVLSRAGESIRGLARCWATCFSMCLQMGVPLDALVQKFSFFRFEPSGFTKNQEIPYAHSIADYVCRWLDVTFVKSGECESLCSVAATGEVRATEDVRVGGVLTR